MTDSLDQKTPDWSLALLRRQRRLTQQRIASVMHVSQARVSDIEGSGVSVELSTLASYVAATGGRLQLTAHYDDGDVVILAPGEANRKARLEASIDRVAKRDAEIIARLAE